MQRAAECRQMLARAESESAGHSHGRGTHMDETRARSRAVPVREGTGVPVSLGPPPLRAGLSGLLRVQLSARSRLSCAISAGTLTSDTNVCDFLSAPFVATTQNPFRHGRA